MIKKIIIADDEQTIREVVKRSLSSEGYELFEAVDGVEALEMSQRLKPDLLLLDVLMPGMAGYEVCRELKNKPETKDIFIFFLTSRDGRRTKSTVIRSGGDEMMIKPFHPAELRQKIRLALAK